MNATAPAPDGALRLSDWGLIRARGAEARSFLQGQLTQAMLQFPAGVARPAGYCSPKGRLLASFIVWQGTSDGELMLACSADLLPATLKRLSMYVLRAQCKLSDASAECMLWGVAGASARALAGTLAVWQMRAHGATRVLRLPDAPLHGRSLARALLVQPSDAAAPALPALAAPAWAALEARSGVVRIVAATQEQFVPQRVNLELVGGVDFKKGCYPGQEVVARSQYRGTQTRRAYLVSGTAAMAPGQEIFHSAEPGQPAGLVALAGSIAEGRFDALAELKIAATADGSLHLGHAGGPLLTLGTLPYALPADVAT
ncbi:MAG: folate-binding protein [Rubrivivax sp. SCN 71-131]|jgi:folate-binding protein YgfZ|nr:MAG: folate-binding protein [Rubrivivax sp. SCN 71-131]